MYIPLSNRINTSRLNTKKGQKGKKNITGQLTDLQSLSRCQVMMTTSATATLV